MTLFEIILKKKVVKILKFSGLTATTGYTYIRIYKVYLDKFKVVSTAVKSLGIVSTDMWSKKLFDVN